MRKGLTKITKFHHRLQLNQVVEKISGRSDDENPTTVLKIAYFLIEITNKNVTKYAFKSAPAQGKPAVFSSSTAAGERQHTTSERPRG